MESSLEGAADPDRVGQLQLLVVDAAARGRRVGSRLMRDALAHMAGMGLDRYRLSTDSDCDWEFYEHIGLRRVAEATSREDGAFRLYVYEGDL